MGLIIAPFAGLNTWGISHPARRAQKCALEQGW